MNPSYSFASIVTSHLTNVLSLVIKMYNVSSRPTVVGESAATYIAFLYIIIIISFFAEVV